MLYILILHYATSGPGLYEGASVIGPMSSVSCAQLVNSNPSDRAYVTCVNSAEANVALDSYGCKVQASTPYSNFTDTSYRCN